VSVVTAGVTGRAGVGATETPSGGGAADTPAGVGAAEGGADGARTDSASPTRATEAERPVRVAEDSNVAGTTPSVVELAGGSGTSSTAARLVATARSILNRTVRNPSLRSLVARVVSVVRVVWWRPRNIRHVHDARTSLIAVSPRPELRSSAQTARANDRKLDRKRALDVARLTSRSGAQTDHRFRMVSRAALTSSTRLPPSSIDAR